jgi:hypothetical protein
VYEYQLAGVADRSHPAGGRIALSPTAMRWISDAEDNLADHCAHGDVVLAIDSIPFAAGREAKDVTVSAAALLFLRTLTHDHTQAAPVTEGLTAFPSLRPRRPHVQRAVSGACTRLQSRHRSRSSIPRERSRFAPTTGRRRRSPRKSAATRWSDLLARCSGSTTSRLHESSSATTPKTRRGTRSGKSGASAGVLRLTRSPETVARARRRTPLCGHGAANAETRG